MAYVKVLNEDNKYWPIEVAEETVQGYLDQGYLMSDEEAFLKRDTELEDGPAPVAEVVAEATEVVEEASAEEAPAAEEPVKEAE